MFDTVLLLSPLTDGSGNKTTILRIKGQLEKNGFQCICKSPEDFKSPAACARFCKKNHVTLGIGIHAFKAGRLLKETDVPFTIILGGTDVNVMSKDEEKLSVMTQVLLKASHVVAFNALMLDCQRKWPALDRSKCSIIPQGVCVFPSSFSVRAYIRENYQRVVCDDLTHMFLIAGGIRPVKNPLFLVKAFSEWQKRCCANFRSLLVILGPAVDEIYFKLFQSEIEELREIVYIPGLALEDCHAAVRDCFCLVNSSESEGMPITVLEAMSQSRPVLVRRNQGNCSIVQDRDTGLLYDTPQEFIEKAEELLEDRALYTSLTKNALDYVQKNHSVESEEKAYLHVIHKMKEII